MHNLHLVRVRASDHLEAETIVWNSLLEWGDENNWRDICGSVSEHNTVTSHSDTRYPPTEIELDTIDAINKQVSSWIQPEESHKEKWERLLETLKEKKIEEIDAWTLSSCANYLTHLAEVSNFLGGVDCLKDTLFEWCLDQCGITDLSHFGEGDRYLVFVDMHS